MAKVGRGVGYSIAEIILFQGDKGALKRWPILPLFHPTRHKNFQTPEVYRGKFYLPFNKGCRVYFLGEYEFLYLLMDRDPETWPRYYYGAREQSGLLLAQVEQESFDTYFTHGLEAFHSALLPEAIRPLMKTQCDLVRMGGLFALHLKMTWLEISKCFRDAGYSRRSIILHRLPDHGIFGTEYHLEGKYLRLRRGGEKVALVSEAKVRYFGTPFRQLGLSEFYLVAMSNHFAWQKPRY